MSKWVNIVAAIQVDTFMEEPDMKEIVEELLKKAPAITGSEKNADVFVNVKTGYNVWLSHDCAHCEYKESVMEHPQKTHVKVSCSAPREYPCPKGEYQSQVVITVSGSLKDRVKEETEKEWLLFLDYIKNRIKGNEGFWIDNVAVNILPEN